MQAILTKYLGPTNFKGSRIRASCERGSITVSYPDELSGDACHRWAVDQLIERFANEDLKQYKTPKDKNPWKWPYVTGELPNHKGLAHVFTEGAK